MPDFVGTPSKKGKTLREEWRKNEDVVRILFDELAPAMKERRGGYTRIVKMHQRRGDACQLAILEWVDAPAPSAEVAATTTEAKPAEAAK